jgi:membrane-associated protease RseP (regulator of RpoE activity)
VAKRWIWGFVPTAELVSYPIGTSAGKAVHQCWEVVTATATGFANIFHASDRSQISGPVGIVRTSQQALKIGFSWYLELLGLISMSLALLNLLPLLPLDGGHIAIAWYEKVRSTIAARRGRPDPGRVDYTKLMPLTYAVILIFGGITILTLAADIVNPISLFGP